MQAAALMQTAAPQRLQGAFRSSSTRQRGSCRRGVAVVRVAAQAQLPKGVTEPKVTPVRPPPTFGFVYNAERLNSRAAMIGFFAILIIEFITNKGILDMLGFTTGQGLPFEF